MHKCTSENFCGYAGNHSFNGQENVNIFHDTQEFLKIQYKRIPVFWQSTAQNKQSYSC